MKKTLFPLLLSIILFSFNIPNNPQDEKKIKQKQTIENKIEVTSSDDWETYVKYGLLSLNWNLDIEYSKELIDKSISIDENYINLEALGDYYYKIEDVDKAIHYYYLALEDVLFEDISENLNRLQMKILTYSK